MRRLSKWKQHTSNISRRRASPGSTVCKRWNDPCNTRMPHSAAWRTDVSARCWFVWMAAITGSSESCPLLNGVLICKGEWGMYGHYTASYIRHTYVHAYIHTYRDSDFHPYIGTCNNEDCMNHVIIPFWILEIQNQLWCSRDQVCAEYWGAPKGVGIRWYHAMSLRMYLWKHAYIHAHIHAVIHTFIDTYTPTCQDN